MHIPSSRNKGQFSLSKLLTWPEHQSRNFPTWVYSRRAMDARVRYISAQDGVLTEQSPRVGGLVQALVVERHGNSLRTLPCEYHIQSGTVDMDITGVILKPYALEPIVIHGVPTPSYFGVFLSHWWKGEPRCLVIKHSFSSTSSVISMSAHEGKLLTQLVMPLFVEYGQYFCSPFPRCAMISFARWKVHRILSTNKVLIFIACCSASDSIFVL